MKNVTIYILIILIFIANIVINQSLASFKIIPEGTPDFILPKLKNYSYNMSPIPAGKYTLIVVYSNEQLNQDIKSKQKKLEIGILPDLKYLQSNSINMYQLFDNIPQKGNTAIFESSFITNANPLTFEALPFNIFFSIKAKKDSVIYNSSLDHKYISIFKHKEKEEYLIFFDLNFDNNFSDLIILINYISACSNSGGGRGNNQGNSPF
jgi:hypothetical protein